jgi:hypothetical protein
MVTGVRDRSVLGVGGTAFRSAVLDHVADPGFGIGELLVRLGLIDATVLDGVGQPLVEFGDELVDDGLRLDALRRGDLGERGAVTELLAKLLGIETEEVGQRLGGDTPGKRTGAPVTAAEATGAAAFAELATIGSVLDELRQPVGP